MGRDAKHDKQNHSANFKVCLRHRALEIMVERQQYLKLAGSEALLKRLLGDSNKQ